MEEKILDKEIEALGWTLDRLDRPVTVDAVAAMIKSYDSEYDLTESKKTPEHIKKIAQTVPEEFDLFYNIISLRSQKYEDYDFHIDEVRNSIIQQQLTEDAEMVILLILLIRYEAVRNEFDLADIGTLSLINKLYKRPQFVKPKQLSSVLDKFTSSYASAEIPGSLAEIDDYINYWENFSEILIKSAKILFKYDWRVSKVGRYHFEKLILTLRREFNIKLNAGNNSTKSISDFISNLTSASKPSKTRFNSPIFDNLIPLLPLKKNYEIEFELIDQSLLELIFIGLKTLVVGQVSVSLTNKSFPTAKETVDQLFMIPPSLKLDRADLKEMFGENDLEIETTEEIFIYLSFKSLNQHGRAIYLLENDFLAAKHSSVKNLIKNLVDKELVEAVVKMPISFDLPGKKSSHSILVLSKKSNKKPLFIDCNRFDEYLVSKGTSGVLDYYEPEDFVELASDMIIDKDEKFLMGRFVSLHEIAGNEFKLNVENYINPEIYSEYYCRSKDEQIIKLSNITIRLKPKRHAVKREYKFLNMADLPSAEGEFLLNVDELESKSKYESKLPLLKQDALLIGKVGSKLKPTLFKYSGKPIYLGPNILALKVKEGKIDAEYLIHELNSNFVKRQLERIPTGRTIPHVRVKDLVRIYLRVPDLKKQKNYFTEWINNIAKERIREIENLHESIKYVEKDVFSSFAHDFGKLQLKVSSSIDVLEAYLNLLSEKEIITLEDSVFGEKEAGKGERVKDVVYRLRESHQRSVNYLRSEVKSLTFDSQENKTIQLGDLIEKWYSSQKEEFFTIELTEGSNMKSQYELTGKKSFDNGYLVKGNEMDIYKILDNLLDNAIQHGFGRDKRKNKFRIHLENTLTEVDKMVIATMNIGNTGRPFPPDFTCEDFFQRRHRGPNSKGEGLGGYSIKRAVDNLGAYISCETRVLSKKEYPVQFKIEFEPYNYDE